MLSLLLAHRLNLSLEVVLLFLEGMFHNPVKQCILWLLISLDIRCMVDCLLLSVVDSLQVLAKFLQLTRFVLVLLYFPVSFL